MEQDGSKQRHQEKDRDEDAGGGRRDKDTPGSSSKG